MNYFNELLDSYSRLKKRNLKLLENTGLDPKAEEKANQYIRQAEGLKGQPYPNYRVEVAEKPGTKIWASRKGSAEVYYDGFGSRPVDVNSKTNPGGFARFVSLFTSDSSTANQGSENEQPTDGREVPPVQQPELPKRALSFLDADSFVDEESYMRAIEELPDDSPNKQLYLESFRMLRNVGLVANQSSPEFGAGSVASTMLKARTIVANCPEGERLCVSESNEQDISMGKQAATQVLQESLRILTKKGPLSLEDIKYIKSHLFLSENNQILLVDPVTKQGLFITQNERKNTYLYNLLKDLSLNKLDENGEKLTITKKVSEFMKISQAMGTGSDSTTRGFFFEDIREASILLHTCKKLEASPEKTRCEQNIGAIFDNWSSRKDALNKAFRNLIDQYRLDGEVSLDLKNDLDLFFQNTIIGQFNNGSFENAEQALNRFSNIVLRLGQLGVTERNPEGVDRTSKISGWNRKADIREIYGSYESARNALVSMGISDEEDQAEIIKKTADGKFSIGDSLKFSTAIGSGRGEVDLGQMARKSMMDALSGKVCEQRPGKNIPDNCEQVASDQKAMMDRFDVKSKDMMSELKRFESDRKKLDSIKTTEAYKDKQGNTKYRASKEIFAAISSDILRNENEYDDEINDAIKSRLKSFQKKTFKSEQEVQQEWEIISQELSNTMQKSRIRKLMQSSDPKDKEKALKFIYGLGVFGGGSSDGSMLSIIAAKDKKMRVGSQNKVLKHFQELITSGRLLDESNGYKVNINSGSFSITRNGQLLYSIPYDGSVAHLSVSEKVIDEIGFKTFGMGPIEESTGIVNIERLRVISEKITEAMLSFSKVLKYLN
jgi:hypothetical protein